jgi:hypothetical protein
MLGIGWNLVCRGAVHEIPSLNHSPGYRSVALSMNKPWERAMGPG